MKIYFAADHAGYELKNTLLSYVRDELSVQGSTLYEVEDVGAHEFDATDDYPVIIPVAARFLVRDIKEGIDARAILIGASGQGEAMVANRFEGVRAAVYYGPAAHVQTDAGGEALDMIESVRTHNDANVLALGARFITPDEAKEAVRKWLSTSFSKSERHMRRLAEIDSIVQV